MKAVFLAQLAATLFMTGLIWFVQVVHYPLFSYAGRADFARFAEEHQNRTTWVVGPAMFVEMATAVLLLGWRPDGVDAVVVWVGFGLLLVVWASTAFAQVPQHGILANGYDVSAHRFLVASNWVRTAAWTARSALLLFAAARLMGDGSPVSSGR